MTDYNRGTKEPPISLGEPFGLPSYNDDNILKKYDMGTYAETSRSKLPFIRLQVRLEYTGDKIEDLTYNNMGVFEQGFRDAIHGEVIIDSDYVYCDIYGHREHVFNFVDWLKLAAQSEDIDYKELTTIDFKEPYFKIVQLKSRNPLK